MKSILALSALTLLAAACDKGSNSLPQLRSDEASLVEAQAIQSKASRLLITSTAGEAIAEAYILIGVAPGEPFADNVFITDASGTVELPAAWNTEQPITIKADGFITATYAAQTPGRLSYSLRPAPEQREVRLQGDLTDFGRLPKDGQLDFGVAIPALTRQDLFRFDVGSILSSKMDRIEVLGKSVEIPGNLTLPNQKERYGLIPLNFNKNNYALDFNSLGSHKVVTIHGQFDVSDVVDALRDKAPPLELVRHFKFVGGGIQAVELQGAVNSKNIRVKSARFNERVRIKAPEVKADEIVLAAAVSENDRVMVPTGVAVLESGEEKAITATKDLGVTTIVTVRKRRADFEQNQASAQGADSLLTLSATLSDPAKVLQPKNLELVAPPSIASATGLFLWPPQALEGVTPAATYVTLSRIEKVQQGEVRVERKTILWEHYSPGWTKLMNLPEFGESPVEAGLEYRWEVSFIGQAGTEQATLGPQILDRASHVSITAKSF